MSKLKVHAVTVPSYAVAQALGLPEGRAQVRAIVAAPSRAAAGRALCAAGLGGHTEQAVTRFLAEWGNVTGNAAEVELALRDPGQVYVLPLNARGVEGVIPWPQ